VLPEVIACCTKVVYKNQVLGQVLKRSSRLSFATKIKEIERKYSRTFNGTE